MLEITSLKKSLGGRRIVSNLSLSVERGEIVGIAGPVGAGKSTLLHLLTGLLDPDGGALSFFGVRADIHTRQTIAQQINYASSSQRLSGYATVWENLSTYADLYGAFQWQSNIKTLWKFFAMTPALLSRKVYRLSSGENSFVNLMKALLNDPKILFLDEITAHMDPSLSQKVRMYIKSRNDGARATILVSQNLEEIRHMCSRLLILKHGSITYDGKPLTTEKGRIYFS